MPDPLVLGSLIAAGGGILQSIGNFFGIHSSNTSNKELNKENWINTYQLNDINNAFNQRMQNQQNQYNSFESSLNRDFQAQQQAIAEAHQRSLQQNAYSDALHGLRGAGLNPAALGSGFNPVMGSAGPQASGSQATSGMASSSGAHGNSMLGTQPFTMGDILSHMGELAGVMINKDKVEADARKANADAHAQEIENRRQESYDDSFHNVATYEDYQGNSISQDEYNKQIELYKNDPDKLPSISIHKEFKNKGEFDASMDMLKMDMSRSELDALKSRNHLEKVVNLMKINNPEVVQALMKIPLAEYDHLRQSISELASRGFLNYANGRVQIHESALREIQKDNADISSLSNFINAFDFSNDMSWKERLAYGLGFGLNFFDSNVKLNANFSKSSKPKK